MTVPEDFGELARAAAKRYPEWVAPRAGEDAQTGAAPGSAADLPAAHSFPLTYTQVELLAHTRLSRTWKAFDTARRAWVVLKEPQARLLLSREAVDRFRREVYVAAQCTHRNIVPILTPHIHEPPYFYSMPFVEGKHLDEYGRGLPRADRLRLFLKVCSAVAHAHERGVIHRDLKPSNILVDGDGEPQLIDFGLGRELDVAELNAEPAGVAGSPGYMSPEQAAGQIGDTRSDVYSLGAVLYELLTGRLPIEPVGRFAEFVRRIRAEPPAPPRGVGRELEAVLLTALAKEPAQRYASVSDLARDIENVLAHRPVSPIRRPGYALRKWLRRHRLGVGLASAAVATLAALGTITGLLWYTSMERERHRLSVLRGRWHTLRNEPVAAETVLFKEYARYAGSADRLCRPALWEFYRRWPLVAFIPDSDGDPDAQPTDLAWSPDGRWLAASWLHSGPEGERGGQLAVYAAAPMRLAHTLPDAARFTAVAFDPSGADLYTGEGDGQICARPFSAADGFVGPPRVLVARPGACVQDVAVSPNGCQVAAAVGTQALVVDIVGGRIVHELDTFGMAARAIAFSPDGRRLAVGTRTPPHQSHALLLVWDLERTELAEARLEKNHVRCVCFSPDGGALAWGAVRPSVWRVDEGRLLELTEQTGWGVRAMSWVAGARGPEDRVGALLAVAGGDGRVQFLDPANLQARRYGAFHASSASHVGLAPAPTGRRLASCAADGIRLWQLPHELIVEPRGAAALAPGGTALTLGPDCLHLWQPGRHLRSIPFSGACERPALDPSGALLAVCTRGDDGLAVVVLDTTGCPAGPTLCPVTHPRLQWLDLPGRPLLVCHHEGDAADVHGRVWVWWPNRGEPSFRRILETRTEVSRIRVHAGGRWVSIGLHGTEAGPDRVPAEVRLWPAAQFLRGVGEFDLASARHVLAVDPPHWFTGVFVRPDGGLTVAATGARRFVTLWDAATRQRLGELHGHDDLLFEAVDLDERLLVTAARDGTVRVWDVLRQEEVCLLHQGVEPEVCVAAGRLVVLDENRLTALARDEIDALLATHPARGAAAPGR